MRSPFTDYAFFDSIKFFSLFKWERMNRRLATAIILLLACAGALSLAAHLFVVFPFDLKITHELQEVQNPVFAAIMQGVSELGEPWFEAVLIVTGERDLRCPALCGWKQRSWSPPRAASC